MRMKTGLLAAVLMGAGLLSAAAPASAKTELTLWSHWANEEAKIAFVNEAVKRFEAKHPDVEVKVTWYQKNPLYQALKVALTAGQAPDIFYTEVSQSEYVDNGFLAPLDDLINWDNVIPWARQAWTFDGKVYALPLETQSVVVVVNTELMKKFGYEVPANRQLTQEQFSDLVKKAAAAGVTPLADGVGDRPYPGLYVTYEALLRTLGREDYAKLLAGELSYTDERVVKTLQWVKSLVDAGAYPPSFTTLKLGESHYYFHTKPGAVMFPIGSWYSSRAFNPPDKGGEPEDFPRDVMRFPAMDGGACNDCETVGIGGSFSINAASEHKQLAADLLNEMATPEMANLWITTGYNETGIKGDPGALEGKYAPYFSALVDIAGSSKGFVGLPHQLVKGACYDTLVQVMNVAFPSGLISVDDAVASMDEACAK